ncbi:hypothetical protein Pmi06nite_10030 [Planotetraspora mira]|uniref:S1 motif domain-containing protein n=2 Tax=Planotetraspora mira TaxID=58121 RepID=A0A8J3X4Y0_9ACTN|nr:hypothetical protein Pmi06nite_10030 [Planotetraspora mira]
MSRAEEERGDWGEVRPAFVSTENPELWAFLESLRPGEIRSGVVAAIESFGVFVALDDAPDHPVFPGVGFISIPELSWRRFDAPSDVVQVGQRVICTVLQFDTWNGEARLSLRATQPDPYREIFLNLHVGQVLQGTVSKIVPFGAFIRVDAGIEGLVHLRELDWGSIEAPEEVVQLGDQVTVVVTEIDGRRLSLSRKRAVTS